jgi:hypothetical protein
MKTILTTDWAPYIERIVRVVAAVLVAVYAAGYCCGEWLHRLNDDITALVVRRPAPVAPLQHPLAAIAADMERLTCRELRAMTGIKGKANKAALITAAIVSVYN